MNQGISDVVVKFDQNLYSRVLKTLKLNMTKESLREPSLAGKAHLLGSNKILQKGQRQKSESANLLFGWL